MKRFVLLLGVLIAAGCNDDPVEPVTRNFLEGTASNPQIGLVVNSTGKALTLFQLGSPTTTREIPFGASSAVTPVNLAFRGKYAVVPLGDAASVALVNLDELRIERFFTFPSGNTTGVAWVNDTTFLVANVVNNYIGKVTLHQASGAITDTVHVAPGPTAIVVAAGRAFVVSVNLDNNYLPIDSGVVTVINPATMTPIDTLKSGGKNSSAAAVDPDGVIYVVNTEDYVADGSVR
jgi:DNA-binding beta-propeller fold protein YncE